MMKEDQKIVLRLNKDAALGLIRRNPSGISRAEIAEQLSVSRSTVSSIVDNFISSGLVLERGVGASRGGRRPIVLEINPDAGRVVGVDMGASHMLVVVADLRGQILCEAEDQLDIASGPEVCLRGMSGLVSETLAQAGCSLEKVRAIGVGVPGPVVAAQGIVSSPPIMPGWDGFPIRQWLEAQWRRSVMIDNDADLGALGEWTFGAGQGEANLAYIKIGTGIGCGILLDGRLYHGVLGTAGEIGHVTISQDGPPCKCGNYGCLEAMAGGRAIAQRAQMVVKAGQRTALANLPPGHEITARDVALAAQAGDAISQQLLGDAGRHIGSALASLINLLNPGLILIGGGVAEAGEFILGPVQEAVQQRSLRASLQATRIAQAALGRHSVSMGAVSLALSMAFQAHLRAGRRAKHPAF
ncbi:MAG TPA: ROK family transcriptional regulator [Anaerolineales bacterium]|nr:ROK family transcriptional regulator [Anaerolineales bacterium]